MKKKEYIEADKDLIQRVITCHLLFMQFITKTYSGTVIYNNMRHPDMPDDHKNGE